MPDPIKLFTCYRSSDAPKVDKIARDLGLLKRDDGTLRYIPWQDKRDIPQGRDWWEATLEAIENCRVFVFYLSQGSLESKTCQVELKYARDLNRPIIPVVLEGEFTFDPVKSRYELLAEQALVPGWLNRIQFLFYTGADFYPQFQRATDLLEGNWPLNMPTNRPLHPDLADTTTNHARYDQACDYAERLAFAEADGLFRALVQRNDRDYASIAAEWLELLKLYAELVDVASRPRAARALFKPLWERYVALFPKDFWDGLFDPKGFAGKMGAQREEPPAPKPELKGMTAEEYHRRGNQFHNTREYDNAIADYTEVIRLTPRSAAAYSDRSHAYFQKGDLQKALEDCNTALEIEPRNANHYDARGDIYFGSRNYDAAIADYERALALDSRHSTAANNLKLAREARAAFNSGKAVSPAPKSMTAEEYIQRGIRYSTKNDYDKAIADFSEAILLNPQNADAYNNRGVIYRARGDYDRAIADYSEAIRLKPQDADVYTNRGLSYEKKGNYDRAIADYDRALEINPKHPYAADTRRLAIKARDANSKKDTPPATPPMTAEEYFKRGNEFYFKKDYDLAIADYTEAIRLKPQFALAYNNRGNNYQAKEDHNRAILDYNEALRLNPQNDIFYNNRGQSYRAKGDYERAIADYNRALVIDPKHPSAARNRQLAIEARDAKIPKPVPPTPKMTAGEYLQRGLSHAAKGEYDHSLEDYSEAIRLNPRYADAYNYRGVSYFWKGDYDSAIADYDRALKIAPHHGPAANNLQAAVEAKKKR